MLHTFVCDDCLIEVKDTNTEDIHYCPDCGAAMRWDLKGIGIAQGDYHHVSDSLAIHPDQEAEHREMFPDVDVLPDGRLEFNSVKSQERCAAAAGLYKKPKRNRKKGKILSISNTGA